MYGPIVRAKDHHYLHSMSSTYKVLVHICHHGVHVCEHVAKHAAEHVMGS